jgi:hypothetical protein
MSISWECCVSSGRGLCQTNCSSRGVLPSVVCLLECDREALRMRTPWPTRGCCATEGGGGEEVFNLISGI